MASFPGCGLIGCVETGVLPQRDPAFNGLPPQLLVSKQSPGERAAGHALINYGTNRWAFKPEVGVSRRWGHWTLDTYGAVWFFTTPGYGLRLTAISGLVARHI